MDQGPERIKRDRLGAQAFPPMPPEGTDNRGNGIFVNTGLRAEDFLIAGAVFIRLCNGGMDFQRDLGIRDNRTQKERMGMVAGAAEDACNPERDNLIFQTQFPGITAIPDQTSGVPTSAGNEV